MYRMLIILLLFMTAFFSVKAHEQDEYILIVSSYSVNYPWPKAIEDSFRSELSVARSPAKVISEYLNCDQFSYPDIWLDKMSLILKGYSEQPPVMIVLIADEAWMAYRKAYAGQWGDNVKILLAGVKENTIDFDLYVQKDELKPSDLISNESLMSDYHITGIFEDLHVDKTIQLMQELLPGMKELVLISDNCFYGIYANLLTREIVGSHFPTLKFTSFDGRFLSTESMYSRLESLSPQAGVLMSSWFQDVEGHSEPFDLVNKEICRLAGRPVFSLSDWGKDRIRFVGGYYSQAGSYGKDLARMALSLMAGKDIAQIPMYKFVDGLGYHLDAKIMNKYGLVLNQDVKEITLYNDAGSFMDQYDRYVFLFMVFVLIALFIILYFLFRTRKYQKELKCSKDEITHSLDNQRRLSEALFVFLQERTEQNSVTRVLKEMLDEYKADRAYIFEFHREKYASSNTYEIVSSFASPQMKNLQNIPNQEIPWLYGKMMENKLLAIDDLYNTNGNIPDVELKILQDQDIVSMLAAPLYVDNELWGYVGVDFVREKRKWGDQDLAYIKNLSQVLCIGIHHFRSQRLKQESELRFGYLYKNMPLGVCLFDRTSILCDLNDLFLKSIGVEDKDLLLGKSIFDLQFIPDKELQRLYENDEVTYEYRLRPEKWNRITSCPTTHKSMHYFTVHVKVLKDGGGEITGYMMVWVDDTHLVLSQQRVTEIESLFTYASDHADVGVSQWNPLTRKGFATDQWFRNLNEESREISEVIGVYKHMHPDDREDLNTYVQDACNGNPDSFKQSIRVWDGEVWHWLKYHATVKSYDPENDCIELVFLSINIDNLKQIEDNLIEAKAKAEESDKLKSAFIANMSHEIRTPLNAIVGFSNILAITDDPNEREEYVRIIATNNDLLLQLINDILDISKIEAGVLEFTDNDVELNRFFVEMESIYSIRAGSGLDIRFIHDENQSCTLRIDRNRLSQVISNFINNSLKFTTKGHIYFGYETRSDNIYFYVEDTGIGIGKDQLNSIFHRFVKLNSFAQGTGLGLSICATIVDRFGGEIGVDSEKGVGSVFWFTVPLDKLSSGEDVICPEKQIVSVMRRDEVRKEKPTILIAEDIEYNYRLLDVVLKDSYTLLHAQTGCEAVELFKSCNPDLILMDVKMPEMDGIEASRLIRELSDVPIIVVSASVYDTDKERMFKLGCNDFIPKPIDNIKLKSLLAKYLN